jgi:DNA-binding MarR family transcriptional regulator
MCVNLTIMKNFITSVNSILEMLSSVEHDINIAGFSLTEKKVYFTIIQITARTNQCNITEVINESHLSRSTVYKAIKKLEENNLLNVYQSSEDKRESFLAIVESS